MTSFVDAPAHALANMSMTTYFAITSDWARLTGAGHPGRWARRKCVAEGEIARLDAPHRGSVVLVQERLIVRVGGRVPCPELRLIAQPTQEGLGCLVVRRMGKDGMAPAVEQMEAAFRALRVHRLAGDFGNLRKIALGDPQDALCVVGAGDLLAQPGLVIVDVGPTERILEHGLLEEFAREVDGPGRLVGIEHHRLAVGLDLVAAERPQQRIKPAVVIAKTVAELESERVPLGLQLGAGFEQAIPGVRKGFETDLLEPVHAPVHQLADVAERDGLPFAVDHAGFLGLLIPAALLLADRFREVAHVDVFLIVKEGPVEKVECEIGAAAGLGNRGHPRL